MLSILGHNVIIENFNDEEISDKNISSINNSILDGNDCGDIEQDGELFEWKIAPCISNDKIQQIINSRKDLLSSLESFCSKDENENLVISGQITEIYSIISELEELLKQR